MQEISVTIDLRISGSIENALDKSAFKDITNLTIIGKFYRSTIDILGKFTNLRRLDLSQTDNNDYSAFWWVTEFPNMQNLVEIILPQGIGFTDRKLFENCPSLKSIKGGGGLGGPIYTKDGVLYSINDNTLIKYPEKKQAELFVLEATRIKWHAFKNVSIKTIVCQMPTPPSCDENAFDGVDTTKIELLVPKGSYYNYKYAKVWKDFLIKEWEVTSPEE